MRTIASAALLCFPFLGGCSAGFGTTFKNDVLATRDFLTDPKTQQAVATLNAGIKVVICDISAGTAIALPLEKVAGAHTGLTTQIYTASSGVCQAPSIGGTPVAQTVLTAPTPVVTVAPTS